MISFGNSQSRILVHVHRVWIGDDVILGLLPILKDLAIIKLLLVDDLLTVISNQIFFFCLGREIVAIASTIAFFIIKRVDSSGISEIYSQLYLLEWWNDHNPTVKVIFKKVKTFLHTKSPQNTYSHLSYLKSDLSEVSSLLLKFPFE